MVWYVMKGTKRQLLAPDILRYIIQRGVSVSGLNKSCNLPYQLLIPSGFFQIWFLPFLLLVVGWFGFPLISSDFL